MSSSLTNYDYQTWFDAPSPRFRLEEMRAPSKHSTLGILMGDQFKIITNARAVVPIVERTDPCIAGFMKISGKEEATVLLSTRLVLDNAYGIVTPSSNIFGSVVRRGKKAAKATTLGSTRIGKDHSIGIFPVAIPLPSDNSIREGKITSAAVKMSLMRLGPHAIVWQEAAARTLAARGKEVKRNISSVDVKKNPHLDPGPVFSVREDGFDVNPPAVNTERGFNHPDQPMRMKKALDSGKWCQLCDAFDVTNNDY